MDPFKVLGVSNTSSGEEIRKAYLDLVKQYHPGNFLHFTHDTKMYLSSSIIYRFRAGMYSGG